MARPLRANLSGGWYYVTSRGFAGQPIYRDVADGAGFMDRVREFPTRFGVEVHAFVLMPNHYHLLLRTPRGNLTRAVQWLNTGYAIWWNGRHGRRGRVFQGRFKHVVVEEGNWLVELSLYLHLNPLAEKRLLEAGDREKRRLEILRSWRWSSYRAYAGLQEPVDGLTVANILGRVPGGAEGYRELAEGRLDLDASSPWDQLKGGYILGSASFAASIRRSRTGMPPPSPAEIERVWTRLVSWVERRRAKSWAELCEQRGEWGRELAWWAGRRHGELSLKQIGDLSGGVAPVTVAKAVERFARSLADHPDRAAAAAEMGQHLVGSP